MTEPTIEPSRSEAVAWIAKARDDLEVANLVEGSQLGVSWAACFHAQQAAEKALKAILVLRGIDFPRSHALERVAALLPPDDQAQFKLEQLAELSPWAVAGRYPEDVANPTKAHTSADRPSSVRRRPLANTHRDMTAARPSAVLFCPIHNERLGPQGLDSVVRTESTLAAGRADHERLKAPERGQRA